MNCVTFLNRKSYHTEPNIMSKINNKQLSIAANSHHDMPDYNQPQSPESHNSIDLSSIINSFHISAVTFTLSLLNKNNFSRC